MLFIYFIYNSFMIANSVTVQKIQTHSTKLDLNQFNQILEQIKFVK